MEHSEYIAIPQGVAELQARGIPATNQHLYALIRIDRDEPGAIFEPGVIFYLGRRVFVHRERFLDQVGRGGFQLPGGWRREPVADDGGRGAEEAEGGAAS